MFGYVWTSLKSFHLFDNIVDLSFASMLQLQKDSPFIWQLVPDEFKENLP